MIRKILKGCHYCFQFLNLRFRLNQNEFNESLNVTFKDSCSYDIDKDQSDINKLFGISYGFHHSQSDRIGWRYIKPAGIAKIGMIELLLYSYVNKERRSFPIIQVPLNEPVHINLYTVVGHKLNGESFREVRYTINSMHQSCTNHARFSHTPVLFNWGYSLGLYFGGNRTAPHTIEIDIDKLTDK